MKNKNGLLLASMTVKNEKLQKENEELKKRLNVIEKMCQEALSYKVKYLWLERNTAAFKKIRGQSAVNDPPHHHHRPEQERPIKLSPASSLSVIKEEEEEPSHRSEEEMMMTHNVKNEVDATWTVRWSPSIVENMKDFESHLFHRPNLTSTVLHHQDDVKVQNRTEASAGLVKPFRKDVNETETPAQQVSPIFASWNLQPQNHKDNTSVATKVY